MDRLSAMRLIGGPSSIKDALPCYACAINNLKDCTHTHAANRNLNSSTPNMVSRVAISVTPIHRGRLDPPPSYFASCPELAPREHVSLTIEDQQRDTPDSANLQNHIRSDATASGEETQENKRKKMITTFAISLVCFLLWIIIYRLGSYV